MMKSFTEISVAKRLLLAFVFSLLLFQQCLEAKDNFSLKNSKDNKIVTATQQIFLPKYPGAHNPAIIKFNDGYLMAFRYLPNRKYQSWISYIGLVLLDESFDPISDGVLLDTRWNNRITSSQSEDARIIEYNGKLYLIYNDNMDLELPAMWERRDIYLTELIYQDGKFSVGEPLKLVYGAKYRNGPWQKNWSPFVWNNSLLISYTINAHEVIIPDLLSGSCQQVYETKQGINWTLGHLRGGTPALLVDSEYLAFFHSGTYMCSECSDNELIWHYFMGAYTFSAKPPFEVTKASRSHIDARGFYTYSSYQKRVIYPVGFVQDGNQLYLSYGKDDCEMWIATINLTELKKSLGPVD